MVGSRQPGDGRSQAAVGIEWASRISTIGMELAVPAGAGYWLDKRWDTQPWLLIAGAVLGFAVFMYHIFQLAGVIPDSRKRQRKQPDSSGQA